MTTNLAAPRRVKDSYVGRTAEGLRMFVTLGMDDHNGRGDMMSVDHVVIPRPLSLSVSGATVSRESARRQDIEGGGQNIDDLRTTVPDKDSSWTPADIDSLVAIWERWHMNDFHAGCVHQPPESIVYETTRGYRQPDLENTPRCPETGYKWGSAWLAEVVPDDVLVEFHRLMDLPLGPAPAWLR